MISRLLTIVLMIAWCFGATVPAVAQGLAGATVSGESKGAPADRAAIKRSMQEHCKQNPLQCEEMKVKMQVRREQCKADPQKCREEIQARHEARCKADPQRCEAMKARMKARREQCNADPQKCREQMRARFEERCKRDPQRCEEIKARIEPRQVQCKADPAKCPTVEAPRPEVK